MSWVARERKILNSGSGAVSHEVRMRRKGGGMCAVVSGPVGRPFKARRMDLARGTMKAGRAEREGERKPRPPRDSERVARVWEMAGMGVDCLASCWRKSHIRLWRLLEKGECHCMSAGGAEAL